MSSKPETTQEVVSPPTELECVIAFLLYQVSALNDWLFEVTFSEDWKTWSLEEQLLFRQAIQANFACGSVHKEKFDSTVWAGHSNGTVDLSVESIRKQREGDAPGKKAEKPTAASILAKRMSK